MGRNKKPCFFPSKRFFFPCLLMTARIEFIITSPLGVGRRTVLCFRKVETEVEQWKFGIDTGCCLQCEMNAC